MKIGILTFHRSHNYGAFLQCYSLVHFLTELNHDVSVINFNNIHPRGYSVRWSVDPIKSYFMLKRYRAFNNVRDKIPTTSPEVISGDCELLRKNVYGKFDVIITGSDEVWRTAGNFRPTPNPYWLPGDMGTKKMSYAVSSRGDFSLLPEESIHSVKECLADFDFISVRDSYTQQQIQSLTEKKVYKCCDPTFLCRLEGNSETGRCILNKYVQTKGKKIVAIMGQEKELIRVLKERFKDSIIIVSLYDYNIGAVNLCGLSPFEWIDVIASSDYLVTNYFHGMCFALKNNKSFCAVDSREKYKERGKMYDLLSDIHLLDQFVSRNDKNYIEMVVNKCEESLNNAKVAEYDSLLGPLIRTSDSFVAKLKSM